MFLIVSRLQDRTLDTHVGHRKGKTRTRKMQDRKGNSFRKQCVRTSCPCCCHLQTSVRADNHFRTCIFNLLTFFPCTLVPYPTLLWSPRLRCITHFQQLVPALKQILRRLNIRCSRPRVLAECHLSTVSYLPKLGAKLMLLPRKPKYPRNFHHSSSIKALKCEDSEMQLARLRFRPRRHPCRQH